MDGQTVKCMDGLKDIQRVAQAYRQRETLTIRHTSEQTDRWTDREVDR